MQAPTSQRVTFWFDPVFSLLSTVDGACQHWVEVKYKQTHVTRGQRFVKGHKVTAKSMACNGICSSA